MSTPTVGRMPDISPSHTTQGLGALKSQYKDVFLAVGAMAALVVAALVLRNARQTRDPHAREIALEKAKFKSGTTFAWSPSVIWTEPTRYMTFFFATTATMAGAVLFGNFEVVRAAFTLTALSLLVYRSRLYSRHSMLLYMLDLCYWVHVSLVYALWFGEAGDRESALWYSFAVYTSTVGPVGGASFMLQTPYLVHHPEAFESFFLHVVPMWVSYAVRWRLKAHLVDAWQPFTSILWVGAVHVYLPWAIFMAALLVVKPYLPKLGQYETLFDWYVGSVTDKKTDTAAAKPDFLSYAWKPIAYILVHGLFSLEGYAAAAMCFQFEAVNLVWIFLVFAGNLKCAYVFYRSCAEPHYNEHNKLLGGLFDSVLCWCVLLPTYYLCHAGYL